jgi:hypothetical protein
MRIYKAHTVRYRLVTMRDELVRKIQYVLERRITTEMEVVYLLVELRKLMDREEYKDPILRMFCNWVVHTALENKTDGSTLILREFDDFIAEVYERQRSLARFEHISFGAFREALTRCFQHFGLSVSFLQTLPEWKTFFGLYALVVSECPIAFTASKKPLKYIKRVELQGVARGVPIKDWPMLEWRLTFHDGTTHHWGFHLG